MATAEKKGRSTYLTVAVTTAFAFVFSACTAPSTKTDAKGTETKEYFAESEYGVKASPRVAYAKSDLRRGGGRYKVGKPYQVKGRWYRPKEDPDYVAEGAASWYGSAFHGRLTANGETYDMANLTAAHPTMPLPSYARVTNLKNDSSVIVRVNDRGPFAKGRVIDLSKRAAELLDYTQAGVAKVRVEYVGPAPLHGQDDRFLMASYRPGGTRPASPEGLPSGVMVAMNEETKPKPEAMTALAAMSGLEGASVELPATGPVVPDRPGANFGRTGSGDLALLSYADRRVSSASRIFGAVINSGLSEEKVFTWWAHRASRSEKETSGHLVNLGTWYSHEQVRELQHTLQDLGHVTVEEVINGNDSVYIASLKLLDAVDADQALRAAWAAGAVDAFAVRD